MKVSFSLLLSGLLFNSVCSAQEDVDHTGLLDYAPKLELTELHFYPSAYCDSATKEISASTLQAKGLISKSIDTNNRTYKSIGTVLLNAAIELCIYMESYEENCIIYGGIYRIADQTMMLTLKLASFSELKGAYRSLTNSWINDFDKDGDIDLLSLTDLTDYELPNEFAPNISSFTAVYYRCDKDTLVFAWAPPVPDRRMLE